MVISIFIKAQTRLRKKKKHVMCRAICVSPRERRKLMSFVILRVLQDRHVKGANREPQMDSSQDYHLQSGYENKTHTVLRFNRRYDTCDPRDLKITVSHFDN